MSLMRNFNNSSHSSTKVDLVSQSNVSQVEGEERQSGDGSDVSVVDMEGRDVQIFGDLSPEALNYIQQLQSELDMVKEVCIFAFCLISVVFVFIYLFFCENLDANYTYGLWFVDYHILALILLEDPNVSVFEWDYLF